MPEYLSPGVYVEEVPSAIQAIAGAGTSTAGFIGYVANNVPMPTGPDGEAYSKPPAGEPRLVTNWSEFKASFGELDAGNRVLANAVYGFFNNGGTRCWVVRVTDLGGSGGADEDDQVAQALTAFEAIDEIAIVAVPLPDGDERNVDKARRDVIRNLTLAHCETMQDRFAILDGEGTVEGGLSPEAVYGGPASADGYGAVYFPYIDVSGNGDYMPASGHIAGIYARVDSSRGVHKAPASEVIRGAFGAKYRLSKFHQDGLNPNGINVIRLFNERPTVWGARTVIGTDGKREFNYVNVRRTLNFLRESIDEGTRWAVFEPNTPELWQRLTRNVSAFLTNSWRAGALFGATPEEAFYVKCDAETNPPDVRAIGQVVTEIGVAIVKPAEFVVFRISQKPPET